MYFYFTFNLDINHIYLLKMRKPLLHHSRIFFSINNKFFDISIYLALSK